MIEVDGLRKVYRVHQKEAGPRGSIRAFVARAYRDVAGVRTLRLGERHLGLELSAGC